MWKKNLNEVAATLLLLTKQEQKQRKSPVNKDGANFSLLYFCKCI